MARPSNSPIRSAATTWVASRVLLSLLIVAVAWAGGVQPSLRRSDLWAWLVFRFAHWDANIYGAIAARGYPDVDYPHSYYAFLPGYPWLLRLGEPLGFSPQAVGLLISLGSGVLCATLLGVLAIELGGSRIAASWSVIALSVSPMTVFFSVAYTEAPFLCLAMSAWILGRRKHWALSGIAAGFACTLRVTGPLLVLGLVVMLLHQIRAAHRDSRTAAGSHSQSGLLALFRPYLGAVTLGLGPLFVAGYMVWLHLRTGQWDAWTVAQVEGFGRASAPPWVGAEDVLRKIQSADTWHLLAVRLLDVVAAVSVWAGAVWLWRRRWYPEGVYVGLCAFSQTFSTIWDSGPRYLHAAFPLYVLVGIWLARQSNGVRIVALGTSVILALFAAVAWGMQWWVA